MDQLRSAQLQLNYDYAVTITITHLCNWISDNYNKSAQSNLGRGPRRGGL